MSIFFSLFVSLLSCTKNMPPVRSIFLQKKHKTRILMLI